MEIIAHIHTDFPTKFGLPRQSGLVDTITGEVVFCPPYRTADALRGLEDFSHIWLLWQFSEAKSTHWSATVRPPRLGGNTRLGVFATRSPFRPNPIGLSCVRLEHIVWDDPRGPVLRVSGADLMDGTPIYDIKPYLPLTDCRPEASEGYTGQTQQHRLTVQCAPELLAQLPPEKHAPLLGALEQDPRPAYQEDAQRVYGMAFAGFDIRFTVEGDTLRVQSITLL